MIPDITEQELKKLESEINKLKTYDNMTLYNIFVEGDCDIDTSFLGSISERISKNSPRMTRAELRKSASNGKKITEMTDAELTEYYQKTIPYINEKELNCLIKQVHRINKGEPRFLNTEEEFRILSNIHTKELYGLKLHGINVKSKIGVSEEFPKADISFENKKLTHDQKNKLSNWIDRGKNYFIDEIFDDVCTMVKKDTYLYRGIKVRDFNNPKSNVNRLNDIKEGAIIDNTNKYISTAGGPEYASSYANGSSFGQGYMLKIKIPKGTKVVDMRLSDPTMDEFTLKPHKLKVTSIDYETGVVECEYMPVD